MQYVLKYCCNRTFCVTVQSNGKTSKHIENFSEHARENALVQNHRFLIVLTEAIGKNIVVPQKLLESDVLTRLKRLVSSTKSIVKINLICIHYTDKGYYGNLS